MVSREPADTTGFAVPGAYMYRYFRLPEASPLAALAAEHDSLGQKWPLFEAGFFQGASERWQTALEAVNEVKRSYSW